MKVCFKRFSGAWIHHKACEKAAEFASELKPENLISISINGSYIVVWYWN